MRDRTAFRLDPGTAFRTALTALTLGMFAATAAADETCQSPYLPKLVGQQVGLVLPFARRGHGRLGVVKLTGQVGHHGQQDGQAGEEDQECRTQRHAVRLQEQRDGAF